MEIKKKNKAIDKIQILQNSQIIKSNMRQKAYSILKLEAFYG